ncbi:hypothetical protein GCM10010145_34280 [Streptomyces ruber]|uniref:Uncharacterized protein n=2 Tax=Streptomyces TaxID=1883 RepID=A0A918BG04_9ACTN|nr:hypothetical protein GCM10010145_34280 [Streptomyces ruber]
MLGAKASRREAAVTTTQEPSGRFVSGIRTAVRVRWAGPGGHDGEERPSPPGDVRADQRPRLFFTRPPSPPVSGCGSRRTIRTARVRVDRVGRVFVLRAAQGRRQS